MTFQTIPVQVAGPSYQSRSKPLSSQVTQNWYQQFDEKGKDPFVLLPFPGLKLLGSATGKDRGFHRMAEILYQVKGTSLYEIDKLGNHTLRGSIPGTGRAIIADDGINMFIVADLKVWKYTTDTNAITQVTDTNITGSNSVGFINNQFLYTKGGFTIVDGNQVGPGYTTVSNVGDGESASGLNVIGAESSPDALLRDYVYDETIYRFGVRTTEAWYNSGVGAPPIDRLQGRGFAVGLGALYSVSQSDQAFYWLGDDFAIYRARPGGSEERVSTDAISHELQKYSDVSDAVGNTFTFEGQNFYMITFPSGDKTFVMNEKLGVNGWFELSSGVNSPLESSRYQGQTIISAYGQNMVADADNGNVYKLDLDTYTNNGDALQRIRVTQSVNGDLLGAKGKRIQMSCIKIIMETGVGLIDGQGDKPRIIIEYSDDGGRTWGAGSWPEVGRLGEFTLQVEWFNLQSFYDRIFRISTTDPVNYSIYSATIDLRLAGK
jgi:hypothetical protein